MLQTKTPDAAVVSGSSGRCKPVNNGHVQLQAAQTVTCSNASASQVNDHLIIDTAEAAIYDAPDILGLDRRAEHDGKKQAEPLHPALEPHTTHKTKHSIDGKTPLIKTTQGTPK